MSPLPAAAKSATKAALVVDLVADKKLETSLPAMDCLSRKAYRSRCNNVQE
jgi:hypothetical protein